MSARRRPCSGSHDEGDYQDYPDDRFRRYRPADPPTKDLVLRCHDGVGPGAKEPHAVGNLYGVSVLTGPIKLVIFDCDGVLVDSDRIAIRVEAGVISRLGWPITEAEIIERFVGHSDEHLISQIEAHLGHKLPADWDKEVEPLYRAAFTAELTPVDGIVEALEQISLLTCVASNGSHEKMRFTLGLTDLYQRFEGRIFSASEVAHGKPAPDLFLHAAAQLGVEPSECMVVEDSQPGIEAARAAGMRVLAYAGGLIRGSKIEGPNTITFNDMRALPALLGCA